MTLASHARGPEFEPRCEYYQNFCEQIFVIPRFFCEKKPILSSWDVFFLPQPIYFGEKKGFIPKTVTPQSPADRGFTVCIRLKRLWSWYKPVLCLYHASIECGSFAYKFFQNWLRVFTLASVRRTPTLFRRRCYGLWTFFANKEKIKTTTKKSCLKMWLVRKN